METSTLLYVTPPSSPQPQVNQDQVTLHSTAILARRPSSTSITEADTPVFSPEKCLQLK